MVNVNIKTSSTASRKGGKAKTSAYQRLARAKGVVQSRKGYSTVARTRGVYAIGETKYFDFELAAQALVASAGWTSTEIDPDAVPVVDMDTLFVPKVGSAINQRIGRSVKVKKIKIRGHISVPAQANQTGADATAQVRLVLVMDTQTNAAQAQGEQVFAAPTTVDSGNAVNSFQSLANLGRFNVLHDEKITVGDPNLSWDGTNMEQQGLKHPFYISHEFKKPLVCHFNAVNGGTVADCVDNSFHLLANCDEIGIAPFIVYQGRITYCE